MTYKIYELGNLLDPQSNAENANWDGRAYDCCLLAIADEVVSVPSAPTDKHMTNATTVRSAATGTAASADG